jgi:hypothetical protein
VVVVLVLACGTVVGAWALTRGGTDGGVRASASVASGTEGAGDGVAGAGTSTPTAPDDRSRPGERPTTTRAEPAPGYSRSTDPVGFTVDVPQGWTRTEDPRENLPTVVRYMSPDGRSRLTLFAVVEETPDASLDKAEKDSGGYAGYRGYQSLGRTSGTSWAQLAFRYDTDDGVRIVIDNRFTAADGKPYAIVFSAPGTTDDSTSLATAIRSFCPAGIVCG